MIYWNDGGNALYPLPINNVNGGNQYFSLTYIVQPGSVAFHADPITGTAKPLSTPTNTTYKVVVVPGSAAVGFTKFNYLQTHLGEFGSYEKLIGFLNKN